MKALRMVGSTVFVLGFFTTVFAGMPWYVCAVDDPVLPWWFRIAIFCLLGGILLVLATLALEGAGRKTPADPLTAPEAGSKIVLSNVPSVAGREVAEVLGIAQGHTIFAIWLGKDLSAMARLILGGELTEYTEMMGKARELATSRMLAKAEAMGADAVVNLRYTTTSVVGSAAELLAYGTAVKLR